MTETDARIEPMTGAHLDAVITLDQRLMGKARKGFFARRMAHGPSQDGATIALVALGDGGPVGFLLARVLDGEFGDARAAAVIDAVGIGPEHRGQGLAVAMMTALEHKARALGVTEIRSEADWSELELTRFFAVRGFELAPHQVLGRDVTHIELSGTFDVSKPGSDETERLADPAADPVDVRSMVEADLPKIVATDRRITGRDREAYYRRKLAEMMSGSGVRLSLVAEIDDLFAGFMMARVDYGDFGRTEATAVIDTIGVAPLYARRGVGQALLAQLMRNLSSLRVEQVSTRIAWDDVTLRAFLIHLGFTPRSRLSFVRRLT